MKNKTRTFDAVKVMRSARNSLSKETAGMSFEEQRLYMDGKLRRPAEKSRSTK